MNTLRNMATRVTLLALMLFWLISYRCYGQDQRVCWVHVHHRRHCTHWMSYESAQTKLEHYLETDPTAEHPEYTLGQNVTYVWVEQKPEHHNFFRRNYVPLVLVPFTGLAVWVIVDQWPHSCPSMVDGFAYNGTKCPYECTGPGKCEWKP